MLSHDEGIAPPGRDEAAGTKAAGHIKSKKSLQKTVMAGRHPHRVIRYYGRIGFTRHQRELLMPRSIFVRNCWWRFSKAGSANKTGSTSLWSRARSFLVVGMGRPGKCFWTKVSQWVSSS